MKAAGLKRGVFIVMNPQTGEVLALVSLPTYDNNLFARGHLHPDFTKLLNDKDKPLTNHAVQAHYPPGSTYKLVAGTGALPDRKITAQTRLRTQGLPHARRRRGSTTGTGAASAPATSTAASGTRRDTFFFQLAGMLGTDRLAYWAQHVRLRRADRDRPAGRGRRHRPVQPVEAVTRSASRSSRGEVYQAGHRPGLRRRDADPAINAYAALANGGTLYQPQLVREIVGPDGDGRPAVQARPHPQAARSRQSVLTTMRNAARARS